MIQTINLATSATGPTGSVISLKGSDFANVFRVDGEPVEMLEGSIHDWLPLQETGWWVRMLTSSAAEVMVSWGDPTGFGVQN